MTLCYNVNKWVYSLYNSVNLLSPQNNSHYCLNHWPQKWVHPLSENVQMGPKVSIFCVTTIIFQHCLTLLGMEFTRASQVATGVLFHSSMMTSRSWWMLETLLSSTFHLRMPHRCSIGFRSGDMLGQSITFTLSFFNKAVVVFMLVYCPAAQSPKGWYHALLQYITVHVGIHGSLNEQ